MGIRDIITVIVLYLTLSVSGTSAAQVGSREVGVADIPGCGLQCMFLKIPSTGCSLSDLGCICNNEELPGQLAACMLANCTMADTLTTARVQADLCSLPSESKRTEVFLLTVLVYTLALFLVVLRIAGKLVSKRLSLDDWIIMTAFMLGAIPLGCVLAMTNLGFGSHLWELQDGTLLPILRLSSSTYVVVLGLIKISLVVFYLEIFHLPRFKLAAYVILGYISLNSLIIFLLTVFSCTPVRAFWDRDVKGKCLNVQTLAYANSASAIVQDIVLLVLPLVFVRNLHMTRYKKVAVGFMFGIGTFGCIATIIRLHTLLRFKLSIDPTWDYAPAVIWTVLELAAGFICISLPSIKVLVVRFLPGRFKKIISSATKSSKHRSNSRPKPPSPNQPHQWHKPSSWIPITLKANDSGHGSSVQESVSSKIWSTQSSVPSTHHVQHGSREPKPVMRNPSESRVTATRSSFLEFRREHNSRIIDRIEQREMPKVPPKSRSRRPSLISTASRETQLTALPPTSNYGVLPDRSFSELDIRRDFWGRNYKYTKDDLV